MYLHKIDPTLSAEQIESTIQVAFDDREVMETADLKDFIEQTLRKDQFKILFNLLFDSRVG